MSRRVSRLTLACFCLVTLLGSPARAETGEPVIAIIIDDLGYNRSLGVRAIDLPAAMTYSVIPEGEHATMLANYAHSTGKEVMVHLPMANTRNRPLGSMALTSGVNALEIDTVLDQAINRVPHAAGLNNHMGSELTRQPQVMAWLMRAIKRRDYYFIDSRTTHYTVASEMARFEQIPSASRDVFLDNEVTEAQIDIQFRRLVALARKKKSAIGIGHPHDTTLTYLERVLPGLAEEGVRIVAVSELLAARRHQTPAPVMSVSAVVSSAQ